MFGISHIFEIWVFVGLGVMVILAVGNVDDMLKGSPDKPEFSLKKFSKSGEIHKIPLPDPLTMVYPKN